MFIVGKRDAHGHIAAIVPQGGTNEEGGPAVNATESADGFIPVTSQAGSANWKRGTDDLWYTDQGLSDKKVWVHA